VSVDYNGCTGTIATSVIAAMRPPSFLAALLIFAAARAATAALSFNVSYVDDANGTFASRGWLDPASLFQQDISAALNQWGRQFNSNATLVVRIDTTSFAARAGGTFTYGRLLYTNPQGKQVWEAGPLTRILTGANPGETSFGYDIAVGVDASFVEQYYWFDPPPELRTAPVPADRGDFVSVVLHELGHGLGIGGNRDFNSGQLLAPTISKFDDLSFYGSDGNAFDPQGQPNPLYFSGNSAAGIFGGDLPLTHKPVGDPNYGQNYYHLSACDMLVPDGLETTLMNGCVLPNGQRLYISSFDRAVIADLGYPMATHLAADFNADSQVNDLDLFQWQSAFAAAGADANHDGRTDGADFLIWQRQLGSLAAIAVPEGSSFLLLLIACATQWPLCGRRISRRSA
jgi:hypothetical protein